MPEITLASFPKDGSGTSFVLIADNPTADGWRSITGFRIIGLPPNTVDIPTAQQNTFRARTVMKDGKDVLIELSGTAEFVTASFNQKLELSPGRMAITESIKVYLTIFGPVAGPSDPRIEIRICGKILLDLSNTGGSFDLNVNTISDELCCTFTVKLIWTSEAPDGQEFDWPDFELQRLPRIPGFELPSFPPIRIPQFHFLQNLFPIKWPDLPGIPGIPLPFPIRLKVRSTKFEINPHPRIIIEGVRIELVDSPDVAIEGDLSLSLKFNPVGFSDARFDITYPEFLRRFPIELSKNIKFESGCFAARWPDEDPSRWATLLFREAPLPNKDVSTLTLHLLWDPAQGLSSLSEFRLDIQPSVGFSQKEFQIPGVKIVHDAPEFLTLLAQKLDDEGVNEGDHMWIALVVTMPAGKKIVASTDLNLESGIGARRVFRTLKENSDQNLPAQEPAPLLTATMTDETNRVSYVLVSYGIGKWRFLRRLTTTISLIDWGDSCAATPADRTLASVKIEANPDQIRLPFLQQTASSGAELPHWLSIRINDKAFSDPSRIIVVATVTFHLGDLKAEGPITLRFDIEKMEFSIEGGGFQLSIEINGPGNGKLINGGLDYSYKAETYPATAFTLNLSDGEFLLTKSALLDFKLYLSSISDEPIVFDIEAFSVSPKGLDLVAVMLEEKKVRLNSLNTAFTFEPVRIFIRESKLQAFNLKGKGPLPPELVGPAEVFIDMRWEMVEDKLELKGGEPKLLGSNLLYCENTYLQLRLDGIGFGFAEEDGKYHIYFTLTGKARFDPQGNHPKDGPLGLLPALELDVKNAPLTGDMSVLRKHIDFTVSFPDRKKFDFLSCFQMELRGIAFLSQSGVVGDDAALLIAGQIKFADGNADAVQAKIDFHGLYIVIPDFANGEFIPRLYCKNLGVSLNVGQAFALSGRVNFVDEKRGTGNVTKVEGFSGEGSITIQGLPKIDVGFGFFRFQRIDGSWVRGWYLVANAGHLSIKIPVIDIYLREVGLGFGYRMTLASIKRADEEPDIKVLLKKLAELSATQGNITDEKQWEPDVENIGEQLRWTIVMRALFAQTSPATDIFDWKEDKEENFPCTILFDAVLAVRSDLTILMTVRAWIFTNYYKFLTKEGLKDRPLLMGFILFQPARKRLLAHFRSNPNADFGETPPVPDFFKSAVGNSQFSATLLIEEGLFHQELGWPNQLSWHDSIEGLEAEFCGGTIFRLTGTEMVQGTSFAARGKLTFYAGVDLGCVGASLSATADIAFAARYIAVLGITDIGKSALYGRVSVDIRVRIEISFWLKIKKWKFEIKLDFTSSIDISFSACVEIGFVPEHLMGLRGRGSLSVNLMGRSLPLSVSVGIKESAVNAAYNRTASYMNIGLEGSEADKLNPPSARSRSAVLSADRLPPARNEDEKRVSDPEKPPLIECPNTDLPFLTPNYFLLIDYSRLDENIAFALLIPDTKYQAADKERGFFPPPPFSEQDTDDFEWELPNNWSRIGRSETTKWQIPWKEVIDSKKPDDDQLTFGQYWKLAFILDQYENKTLLKDLLKPAIPIGDPRVLNLSDNSGGDIEDPRTAQPVPEAYEAALRGAYDQITASPLFRFDPKLDFDRLLADAFDQDTNPYLSKDNELAEDPLTDAEVSEQANQVRGAILRHLAEDLHIAATAKPEESKKVNQTFAARLGLLFKTTVDGVRAVAANVIKIKVRGQRLKDEPWEMLEREVKVFNPPQISFSESRVVCQEIKPFADASTIALTWKLVPQNLQPLGLTGTPLEKNKCVKKYLEDHHSHYFVYRRRLDGQEPDREFKIQSAWAWLRKEDKLYRIPSRFQFVDHFGEESADDIAAITSDGRTYVYTVTPVDQGGRPGISASMVVNRPPRAVPPVPSEAELKITFDLNSHSEPEHDDISALSPLAVDLTFLQPLVENMNSQAAIQNYRLIFRRHDVLRLGSYGLGGETESDTPGLPPSRSRRRDSDLLYTFNISALNEDATTEGKRSLQLVSPDLNQEITEPFTKVFGRRKKFNDEPWTADAWQVFLQSISAAGVESSLVTVRLAIAFQVENEKEIKEEIRYPLHYERIARPKQLPMVSSEMLYGRAGMALVPMPVIKRGVEPKGLAEYKEHPDADRIIEIHWSHAGVKNDAYSTLRAGYTLYEFDATAHPKDALALEKQNRKETLRLVEEVIPHSPYGINLQPSDTLSPHIWEAWYPSDVATMHKPEQDAAEHFVFWPTQEAKDQISKVAYSLRWIGGLPPQPVAGQKTVQPAEAYNVFVQPTPAGGIQNWSAFREATAVGNDRYGWRLLQRLGLTLTFFRRRAADGVLDNWDNAWTDLMIIDKSLGDQWKQFRVFEQLFRPDRRARAGGDLPGENPEQPVYPIDHLLPIQVSLRPRVYRYWRIELRDKLKEDMQLNFPSTWYMRLGDDLDEQPAKIPLKIPKNSSETYVQDILIPAGYNPPESILEFIKATVIKRDFIDESVRKNLFRRLNESLKIVLKPIIDELIEDTNDFDFYSEANLQETIEWQYRFVRHSLEHHECGSIQESENAEERIPVATAYPISGAPFHIVPDANGAMEFRHPHQDPWAHHFRYFVQPHGRYDALWLGLRRILVSSLQEKDESNYWETELEKITELPSTSSEAGLDIVLPRIHPIESPLIVYSGTAPVESKPWEAGTWAVVLARHPEQILIERNQTLYRMLEFRDVAHSLFRTLIDNEFAKKWLKIVNLKEEDLQWPEVREEPVLALVPPLKYQKDFTPGYLAAVENFRLGSLAIEYESLPFYYRYLLFAVARTDRLFSPPAQANHQTFHYKSPTTLAFLSGAEQTTFGRRRILKLILSRYVDCLPDGSAQRWKEVEFPDSATGMARLPGCLPDKSVIYEIFATQDRTNTIETLFTVEYGDSNPYLFEARTVADGLKASVVQVSGAVIPQVPDKLVIEWSGRFKEIPLRRDWKTTKNPFLYYERSVVTKSVETIEDEYSQVHVDVHASEWQEELVVVDPNALPARAIQSEVSDQAQSVPYSIVHWLNETDSEWQLILLKNGVAFWSLVTSAEVLGGPNRTIVVHTDPPWDQNLVPPPLVNKIVFDSPTGEIKWTGSITPEDLTHIKRWERSAPSSLSQALNLLTLSAASKIVSSGNILQNTDVDLDGARIALGLPLSEWALTDADIDGQKEISIHGMVIDAPTIQNAIAYFVQNAPPDDALRPTVNLMDQTLIVLAESSVTIRYWIPEQTMVLLKHRLLVTNLILRGDREVVLTSPIDEPTRQSIDRLNKDIVDRSALLEERSRWRRSVEISSSLAAAIATTSTRRVDFAPCAQNGHIDDALNLFQAQASSTTQFISWQGRISPQNVELLSRWTAETDGRYLSELLVKFKDDAFAVKWGPGELPWPCEIPPILRERLEISPSKISWKNCVISDAEMSALGELREMAIYWNWKPLERALEELFTQIATKRFIVPRQPPGGPQAVTKVRLIFDGILVSSEWLSWRSLASGNLNDEQALDDLYKRTLWPGVNPVNFGLRARRGGASSVIGEVDLQ